ncbi:MAG: Mpo1-like protein [Alphaproteobacteria bacterium]
MAATPFERQLAMYATYHRDRRTRLTHVFGIPAIIVALLTALTLARIEAAGTALSLAVVVAVAAWALWIAFGRAIGLTMGLFLAAEALFALGFERELRARVDGVIAESYPVYAPGGAAGPAA